jgi:3-hydroxyisobutyrate dehydrogenase-like beta-hydroxyacid dehydrogenase
MTDKITTVGFIGLGVMGSAQCANLVGKSGLPVTVYDVHRAAIETLVHAGAHAAPTVADLARTSQVIFLSLPGGPQVESVLFEPDGVFGAARPGSIVVDLSTSPVALARRAGDHARTLGLHFVDAPVARTRQAAIDGTLSITAGGDHDVLAAVEPLLRTMATDIIHCGRNGAGALMKIANNMIVFETVVAIAEALTLVRRSGLVDPATAVEALASGSAASFTLENHGRKALLPDTHAEGIFPAEYMRKDLGYALDAARDVEVELPAAALAHDLLRRTCEAGYAKNYHTAVVRVIDRVLDEATADE